MGLTNFPNGISSMGMPIVGGGMLTSGSVFFVHSGTGSDGNSGEDTDHPLATVDAAINKCTANKGDVIFAMPGHSETATTAALFDADIAGISIIGLGNGNDRPLFTLGTSTGADIDLNADGVLVRNLRFDFTGIDAIAAGLDVDGANITIEECDILMADTAQATMGVDVGGSSHGFTFRRNIVHANTAGANSAIRLGACATAIAASNDVLIEGNTFDGDFAVACIENTDGTTQIAHLRTMVRDNVIVSANADEPFVSFGVSGSGHTGTIINNYVSLPGTSAALLVTHKGDCRAFQNYVSTFITLGAIVSPAAAMS